MTQPLEALLARVEGATGADQTLDRDLALAMGWKRELDRDVYMPHHAPPWSWVDPDGYYQGDRDGEVGPVLFTRSLDAALSLVERVLPTLAFAITHTPERPDWLAKTWSPGDTRSGRISRAATPALALLAALLRALISQQKTAQGEGV